MTVRLTPCRLTGAVKAVSSKSEAHRLLICAGLSDSNTELDITDLSDDIRVTMDCLKALGAKIKDNGEGRYEISPIPECGEEITVLDCGESGSTLRFMLPVAAALGRKTSFIGRGRLPQRPLKDLIEVLSLNGCVFSGASLPLEISGELKSGLYTLPGDVSSQYASGLLFALPLLQGDSELRFSTPLQSVGYVEMTIDALGKFGINIDKIENGFYIKGGQRYISPGSLSAGGDWSNAAFFLTAGAIGGTIQCGGLSIDSQQGDRRIADLLKGFGADVMISDGNVCVSKSSLKGCEIDVSDIPDLLPILAVAASVSEGTTKLKNASRLRLKESDRLASTAEIMRALGADVQELPDALIINGVTELRGGTIDGHNDHRIVMAASIASIHCKDNVIITGAEAIDKSYPRFFEDFNRLGGNADVV